MTALLQVKNLHIAFGSMKKPVVLGIDLSIEKGETFALVGESGSGKSVTALAICGLLGPSGQITDGEIWLQNTPLHMADDLTFQKVRGRKIGMIFQDPMTALNPTMSVGRQIAEVLVWHENLSWKSALDRAAELMHNVGISDPHVRSKFYPFQLSGGLRQRVMIAIALACNPSLLIADEPTTALDVTIQAQILELLRKICQKNEMGLLLITHDFGVVSSLCSRAAVMQKGVIVESGFFETIFNEPQHPYTRLLLEASNCRGVYAQ